MILGIGTDIVCCDRFSQKLDNRIFLKKLFTDNEIDYCSSKGVLKSQSYAGTYAAKEAFVKALGVGFRNIAPRDVKIERDNLGKPYIVNSYDNIENIFLSISHEKDSAIAFVILEGDNYEGK